jgi:trans-aconitate 2-methyltransferase
MNEIENDWDPDLYLKFNKERIQPTVDLIFRIQYSNPKSIIDIGCGPGNSTQMLSRRWPDSTIVGIDNSANMIKKANKDFPNQKWMLIDAGKDEIPGRYDIVFSNATIQWIPDHYKLFIKVKALLNDKGLIAIQIPLFFEMKIGQSIRRISNESKWSKYTGMVSDLFTIHTFIEYYDMLSELFDSIEIWETDYIHIMDSQNSILEMIKSTGLKPYLERFQNDSEKRKFEQEVIDSIVLDYPIRADGKVLFPFKRLFIIVR